MGIRDWFLGRSPQPLQVTVKPEPKVRGSFAGALLSRNVGFDLYLEPPNSEIKRDLVKLRAHARDLAKNNAYAARYHGMCATHIVGPDGVVLESGILGNSNKPKESWNNAIEDSWSEWGRTATADGQLDWIALQQLIVQTVSIDGECILKINRGYPNKWGFALSIIDADSLDYSYNEPQDAQGNRCQLGVRQDKWGRPTEYRFWTSHPADHEAHPQIQWIPAADIIHIYSPLRGNGVRGLPWTHPVMNQMSLLGRLFSAELNSAIAESRRLGVIKSSVIDINDETGDTAQAGDAISNAEAISSDDSEFLGLDAGLDVSFAPPVHPNSALNGFAKTLLEGIAAGLGVAYHSLTMDVSQSNYSSSRVALLEERDNWVKLQHWFIDRCCNPIFEAFLESAIATGAIKIPLVDFKKAYKPLWWPRSWQWVDPEKDARASSLAIEAGLTTYQEEIGSQGRNWRKVLKQRAEEQAYIKELGLEVYLSTKTVSPTVPQPIMDPAATSQASKPAPDPKPSNSPLNEDKNAPTN